MKEEAILALEDGTVFRGVSIGATGYRVGEVVFNTAMAGYQEILTDPSYARQIVTLTYPHIGNTGVNPEDRESNGIYASGLIVKDVPTLASNWRMRESLSEYLKRQDVVALAGIDTRQLTRVLREKGAQRGCLWAGADLDARAAVAKARDFPGLKGMDLAREVSCRTSYVWRQTRWRPGLGYGELDRPRYQVVAYDFGVKLNILRELATRGCEVTVVPATTPAAEALSLAPDGILLSNGPGDPEPCSYAIEAIREFLAAEVPVFGICLGHQLLALACGAKTVKMKFGHHGANHPVLELASGRVMISSQNHGFAVDEQSLPPHLKATHRSLFDGSLQGIEHAELAAFGFQGHPEASPGPHDGSSLFDRFVAAMARRR
ncbi:MAG: glutamine-hydrolyzing carbamoyl-phosphate synthase small subunit [Methylohalobius sp.]|nr:glutamine-hydrolyzing carbamoyl-phosphate synthase small subunit [Methylohalobius sp.]